MRAVAGAFNHVTLVKRERHLVGYQKIVNLRCGFGSAEGATAGVGLDNGEVRLRVETRGLKVRNWHVEVAAHEALPTVTLSLHRRPDIFKKRNVVTTRSRSNMAIDSHSQKRPQAKDINDANASTGRMPYVASVLWKSQAQEIANKNSSAT